MQRGQPLIEINMSQPLFNKSVLAMVLKTSVEEQPAIDLMVEINMAIARELLRCVMWCPEEYLARLACGSQPLGVAFERDLSDFKIIFLGGLDQGLEDPWHSELMDEFELPPFPSLSQDRLGSEVFDTVATIAGISPRQRERLSQHVWLDDEATFENMVEMLMLNPRVTEGLRVKVMEVISVTYVHQLNDCPEQVYLTLQDRVGDQVWEQERRAARAKG